MEHTFRHVTSRDAIGESEGYPNRVNSLGYFQNILLYQSCNRGYMKKLALGIALITTMVLSVSVFAAMIPSVSADPHKPCSGNPHFPDGTQNPHDNGEAGNPHDVGGHFEFDGCPGSK